VDEPVNLLVLVTLLVLALLSGGARAADGPLVVGSKRFTESYILGEVVAQAAQPHTAVQHRQGLGNTAVVLAALKAGAIDVYPEYLGTIDAEILKNPRPSDLATLQRQLAPLGLGVGVPLGFQNTYALAMAAPQAQALGVRRISDLAGHPALVTALSHEFLGRADGWPGLAARYQLPQRPTGIDHGLALDALAAGRIALTDIYSTDAKIAALGLVVLEDDAAYFPRYDAVLLYRLDAPTRAPAAWRAIPALQGRISAARMIQMNGDAELRGQAFATIAQGFLASAATAVPVAAAQGSSVWRRLVADDLGRLTLQHLMLVGVALAVAVVVGVPLGMLAAERPAFEQPVMAVVGVLQTVPSLALLALLIPLLGRIGTAPALVALSLYALLPIVRNVTTGLRQVPAGLRDAAVSLALTRAQRWRHIELPLALPVIVAGIKTAAVITVGTATIAAFIGAGGYGERIATGLALNDHATLVAGALPAALMALLTQLVFEWAERRLVRRAPSKPTATVSPPRPPSGWPRNR
jgi:osmoprotectant transport system permease protein